MKGICVGIWVGGSRRSKEAPQEVPQGSRYFETFGEGEREFRKHLMCNFRASCKQAYGNLSEGIILLRAISRGRLKYC